jgi:hypothetical protein
MVALKDRYYEISDYKIGLSSSYSRKNLALLHVKSTLSLLEDYCFIDHLFARGFSKKFYIINKYNHYYMLLILIITYVSKSVSIIIIIVHGIIVFIFIIFLLLLILIYYYYYYYYRNS